ncbi:unnamed protein product [Rotaria sordida]|uniref:Tetratricopeptide repeat protein n=2 Tax=Rotaria sordida TaxID=392033 RepID=A0A814NAR6_9BILA|nr:unnamed protein product [Rotaria sordida]CAF1377284.1 unnamed protein product [Rotaria sordida]
MSLAIAGDCYRRLGYFDKALELLQQSLEVLSTVNDQDQATNRQLTFVFIRIALVFCDQGDNEQALLWIRRSFDTMSHVTDIYIAPIIFEAKIPAAMPPPVNSNNNKSKRQQHHGEKKQHRHLKIDEKFDLT